jgi:hypothetical protein
MNGGSAEHYVSIAGLKSVSSGDPVFKVPPSPLQRQTWYTPFCDFLLKSYPLNTLAGSDLTTHSSNLMASGYKFT